MKSTGVCGSSATRGPRLVTTCSSASAEESGIGGATTVKNRYYQVEHALRKLGDEEIWELMLTAMDAGSSGK